MKNKIKKRTLAMALAFGMCACACGAQAEETVSWSDISRVSVHDPSIIAADDGAYYVIGSHTASAQSEDLIQWTQLCTDYGNVTDAPFYGDLQDTHLFTGTVSESIWGSMVDTEDTGMVLGIALEAAEEAVPSTTKDDLDLPTSLLGATITWTSSEPDAISETGAVTRSDENVKVELTAEISYNGETVTETYEVTVRKSA